MTRNTNLLDSDKILILEHGTTIMSGLFAEFSSIYDQLRVKVLSMLGAQLVILTFIFSGWALSEVNFDVSKWIFFGIAVLLQVIPVIVIFWILSPLEWLIPGGSDTYKDMSKKYDDYLEYLEKIHEDFAECINVISKPVSKRSKAFTVVLYAVSVSTIILLILKHGG